MILGRNSLQWLGLLAVLLQIAKQFLGSIPEAGVVLDFLTAIDAALMTWIAQTSTTPTADPQLVAGTMVRITDKAGRLIDHAPIEAPSLPAKAAPRPPRNREVE